MLFAALFQKHAGLSSSWSGVGLVAALKCKMEQGFWVVRELVVTCDLDGSRCPVTVLGFIL